MILATNRNIKKLKIFLLNKQMKNEKIKFCANCLAMSTRPRITFNKNSLCNACAWVDKKKKINWNQRKIELEKLLSNFRKKNDFDCIVPVSGGKDGSYVAYNLKKNFNMNPLCVTIRPHLYSDIGEKNLQNFIKSGYQLISVDTSYEAMRSINKQGFLDMGMGYYGWLISIFTGVIRVAEKFNINLIFYAEDGEIEYGGSTENQKNHIFDIDYVKKIYVEGGYEKILNKLSLSEVDKFFFTFPEKKIIKDKKILMTHFSYFENWDPYRNYIVAKENCGLIDLDKGNLGTFTNFAQNDQLLCALHYYLMYLKFGFGRANQDASIEIRRGAMSREQGINLVNLYDNCYPKDFVDDFLNYFDISKKDFDKIIDKWANKNLFKKDQNNIWQPQFKVF
jgi:N-acetyl sugar amidotransferase